VAKAVLVHHEQGVTERFVGIHSLRFVRHHLGQLGGLRIESLRHDAKHGIAFGKNSDQAFVFDDHDCAYVLACHQLGGFADGSFGRGSEKLFSLHHLFHPLTEHRGHLQPCIEMCAFPSRRVFSAAIGMSRTGPDLRRLFFP
jgi:hypothetical protein